MNKLYIFKDTVTLFGSLLHLQRRKPLPVKGSKTAGCINSSQIAAQYHFIFGNITVVRQQLQISTVVRYILFIYTQKPQNTAAAFGNDVIFTYAEAPKCPGSSQRIHRRMHRMLKGSLSLPCRNRGIA